MPEHGLWAAVPEVLPPRGVNFLLARIDVLAQTFSGILQAFKTASEFTTYFLAPLESCYLFLFLLVSLITFHLTPPALPAYTVIYFPFCDLSAPSNSSGNLESLFQLHSSTRLSLCTWNCGATFYCRVYIPVTAVRSNNGFVSLFVCCLQKLGFYRKWRGWWPIQIHLLVIQDWFYHSDAVK